MQITKRSPFTGKERTLEFDITPEQFEAWKNAGDDDPNRFIQNAFPNLTDGEREFIMTGITQDEWDAYLPDEDELPEGDSRPDAERVDVESLAETLPSVEEVVGDHPTKYTDADDEDWMGR